MKQEEILEQIFDNGFATKTVEIGKKVKVVMKSLSAKDYMDLDPLLNNAKGTKLYVLQTYGIAKLSRAIVNYNGVAFDAISKASDFLSALPAALVDKLLKEHSILEEEVKKALNPEAIEESFFEETGSVEKQEQPPKELPSESQED